MTPVYGSGVPREIAEAIQRAEQQYPDLAWAITLDAGQWRIMAQRRQGRRAHCELQECVVNHHEVEKVLDHYCEEVAKELAE